MSGATRKPQVGDVVMINGRVPRHLWDDVPPGTIGMVQGRTGSGVMWWVQLSDVGAHDRRWFFARELSVLGDVR
jgi:hypothetical protein